METMKVLFRVAGILLFLGLVLGIVGVELGVIDLAWMPWRVGQETKIVRASNGYVTAQQEALRNMKLNYAVSGDDAHRNALVRSMCETADKIPGNVQPDIESFLAQKGC